MEQPSRPAPSGTPAPPTPAPSPTCAPGLALPSDEPATPKPTYTLEPPTPVFSPVRTAAPAAHGTPYTADDLWAVMCTERWGLAAQARQPWIAAALAPRIWTYDGQPYQELSVGARCESGDRQCDLQVEGTPGYAPDRDASDEYIFEVLFETRTIEDVDVGLGGFPHERVPEIDRAVRALIGDQIGDRQFQGLSWLLQPPDDGFRLRYGHGDTEGEQALLVEYDRATNRVLSVAIYQY